LGFGHWVNTKFVSLFCVKELLISLAFIINLNLNL